MSLRSIQTLMLASAAVLLGHIVGYSIAHPSRALDEMALGGHTYIGPAAALLVPAGFIALLAIAVRSVRRIGVDTPTLSGLIKAQVAVFVIQEMIERPAAPWSAFGDRAVLFGLIAQVLIAWLVIRQLRWTERIVRQVLRAVLVLRSAQTAVPVAIPADLCPSSQFIGLLPRRRGPPHGAVFSPYGRSGGVLT